MSGDDLVLNVSEACKLLKLSRGAVYLGIKNGELPALKVGRRILIPKAALEKLLDNAGHQKEGKKG